jgi:hypothetical protein
VLKLGNNSIAQRYKNSREATDDASADTSGSVLDPYYDGALDLSSDGVITPVYFFWCHLNVGFFVRKTFTPLANPDSPTTSKSMLPAAAFETPSCLMSETIEDTYTSALVNLGLWIPQIPIEFMRDHILPPIHCNVKRNSNSRSAYLLGRFQERSHKKCHQREQYL